MNRLERPTVADRAKRTVPAVLALCILGGVVWSLGPPAADTLAEKLEGLGIPRTYGPMEC